MYSEKQLKCFCCNYAHSHKEEMYFLAGMPRVLFIPASVHLHENICFICSYGNFCNLLQFVKSLQCFAEHHFSSMF